MLTREDCATLVAPLATHPGVDRVLVAHADGVPHFDTASLERRERGAAAGAVAAGTAAVIGAGMGVDTVQGVVVYAADSQVIARPLGDWGVLVVAAQTGPAGDGVYPLVRRIGRLLDEAAAVTETPGDAADTLAPASDAAAG